MTQYFQAIRCYSENNSPIRCQLETMTADGLGPGDVTIQVAYSSVNYKDALAVTGQGRILKKTPLIPGIDLAGTVLESDHPDYRTGDNVLVTGCNLGEQMDGGLSQVARVPASIIVPCPTGLNLREAMTYGTAGFTAALCVERMCHNGQTPEMGPILVTGASGGVGSFAVAMLAKLGFQVIAASGKRSEDDRLLGLGANRVCSFEDLALGDKPLESVVFGGAIDNVGGKPLTQIIASTQLWGNVALVGLAGSHELPGTVLPMILRGVSLLGISSNNTPMELRRAIWDRLAGDWQPKDLASFVTTELHLDQVPEYCERMIARKTSGRAIVKLMAP